MATSRLAYWRKRRGLSQQALADMAGITQSALSQMERGTRAPKGLVSALATAAALRCAVTDIWDAKPVVGKRQPTTGPQLSLPTGAKRRETPRATAKKSQ